MSAWHAIIDAALRQGDLDPLSVGGDVSLGGRVGSSTSVWLAALSLHRPAPRLLVTAHIDQADEVCDEFQARDLQARRFPALETLPGEQGVRSDLLAERLAVLRAMASPEDGVVVAPIAALMQPVPDPESLTDLLRTVRPGDRLDRDGLLAWLASAGWDRAATVERPGEFAVRGDVIDIFPEVGEPSRLDFFGDQVESVHAIDLDTMGSAHALDRLDLVAGAIGMTAEADPGQEPGQEPDQDPRLLTSLLDDRWEVVIDDPAEVSEQSRAYLDRTAGGGWLAGLEQVQRELRDRARATCLVGGRDTHHALPVGPLPAFPEQASDAVDEIRSRAADADVMVVCQHGGDADRMRELLGEVPQGVSLTEGYLHRGFVWHGDERPTHLASYDEIVHRYQVRRRTHGSGHRRDLDAFVEITPGDHVVHREHGIAAFLGMQLQVRHKDQEHSEEEFLVLEFAQGARLLVPATSIDDVHRYIGAFKGAPERSMLGGKAWANRKERAADSVRELAAELLRVQAVRQSRAGVACPEDGAWQHEFEAAFPWDETKDQESAFQAVRTDMQAARPMDRLVCGDVGFGKTEVAIRAAFRAAAAGRQVAVLVPTTVLAEQHERTFRGRFAGYPFRIESMSRFKTPAEQRVITSALSAGEIDVLVGTHRLLSEDVRFKDLGLVVIDEEQRFGVEHKQRLLQLRATVDVLTMTATPIPRTLHMSMMGLRDISSLQTAPVDRRAVVTEVMPWNEGRLRAALARELAREGQVFVVHNRVRDLGDVAEAVHALAPDARIATGHGRMSARELEKTMLAFMRHEIDVLVATTIIESGIDIPNANTIIINEADRYGLADLHQLRGRVGRSRHRAYCYLVLPMTRSVRPEAQRRLQALEAFSMLGAGFRIALRDLELRGAGNLLGPEQSGHIAAVGYELYCRLLERAVEDLREGRRPEAKPVIVDVGWTGYLPAAWIPAEARRLDAYRRLCRAGSVASIEQVVGDLESAYGPVPEPALRLRRCREVAVALEPWGVSRLVRRADDLVLVSSRPAPLLAATRHLPGKVRQVGTRGPDGEAEIWWRPPVARMSMEHVHADLMATVADTLRPECPTP